VGRVRRWWRWLPFPWRKWRIVDRVRAGDEVPVRLPRKGAVLVAPEGIATWLAFDCPCGIGHRIMLNLDQLRYPRWRVHEADPLTVWPSVDDQIAMRRCHFVLRRGEVTWVRDDELGDES
jgi:hypothetical protein